MPERARSISFEDFTEATLSSVIRAMDARSQAQRKFAVGPIIFGIIWYPELIRGLGEVIQQPPLARTQTKSGG